MKAIFLDAVNRTITEVEINPKNSLTDMYKLIGCQLVERVGLDDKNDLWVDEEGLLGDPQNFILLKLDDGIFAFAGSAIILSHNGKGKSIATNWTIEDAKAMFDFGDRSQVQFLARNGFIRN
jgi:hypothetical protein